MADNQPEDLVGSWVLLHPDVYFDREKKHGYTGQVTSADVEGDRFYVALGGEPKLFAGDWLMVLKEQPEIYGHLTANMQNLGKQEILDLYSICMLLDSVEDKDQRKALEIASANPNIREHTLLTLEEKLERRPSRGR